MNNIIVQVRRLDCRNNVIKRNKKYDLLNKFVNFPQDLKTGSN